MKYLLPIFKGVSVTFALSAVFTGLQAIIDPIAFSKSFGLALSFPKTDPIRLSSSKDADNENEVTPRMKELFIAYQRQHDLAKSYVALMGARQLGTGIVLLIFAYQGKWTESATVLSTIGIVVAGLDGVYLARVGLWGRARFHAIPGTLIAALAGAVLYSI